MAEPTTTRPARRRAASPAKAAAPAKVAAAKPATTTKTAETPEGKTTVTRFQVELDHDGPTKSYEKFVFPESYKGTVVGSVYAPLGTSRVVVLVIGSDDTESPEA